MMDAVHVDSHQHRLQPAFHPLGQGDIAVLDAVRAEHRKTMSQRNDSGNIEKDYSKPAHRQ
jgi:hypothetical protein